VYDKMHIFFEEDFFMFCNQCGNQVTGGFCAQCGTPCQNSQPNAGMAQQPPPHMGHAPHMSHAPHMTGVGKSKMAAGLIAILVGYGIHNFYLGYTKKAIIQLCLLLASTLLIIIGSIVFSFVIVDAAIHDPYLYYGLPSGAVGGMVMMIIGSVMAFGIRIFEIIDGIRILTGSISIDSKGVPLV